jgi:trimeric autotransporter adhesin
MKLLFPSLLAVLLSFSLTLRATPLNPSQTGGLAEAITAARHSARPVEDASGHWWIQNPANGFNARFTPEGLSLRISEPGESERPHFTRWRTTGIGYDGMMQSLPAGKLEAPNGSPGRIEIHREGLVEWFVNRPSGLEHGYIVEKAPDLGALGRALRLEIALEGELDAVVVDRGDHIILHDAGGREVVRYESLKAWDATGRPLDARLSGGKRNLVLEVEDAGATYPLTIDPTFVQQAYVKASNTGVGDHFGFSVAIDGDTVVVGAPSEDSGATGVNGDEDNDLSPSSGAAYVLVRSGKSWTQQAYLKAFNTAGSDKFGTDVAIDGDLIVVGAPDQDADAGAAYVYQRTGEVWSNQGFLKASNAEGGDQFGGAVAIGGNTIVVGAANEDSAATGVGGNQADNTATWAGAAFVFVYNGAAWIQRAYLKGSNTEASDRFGASVAVDGDTVIVGAWGESSNAVIIDGDGNNNTSAASGAAYVFVRFSNVWSQQAYLKAANADASDRFGTSVAIDGETAIVGAYREDGAATGAGGNGTSNGADDSGAAYVFQRETGGWEQQAYLKASNTGVDDFFGWSVDLDGDRAIVGAYGESSSATGINGDGDNDLAVRSGAAYLYFREGSTWAFQEYLKAANTDELDEFGADVAISGNTAIVGSPYEFGGSSGVGGDGSDNSMDESGAAYLFKLADPAATMLTEPKRFKTTSVGKKSKAQNLTVTNGGDLPLENIGFTVGGKGKKDFRMVAPVAASLAPGESATVKVTFKPRRAGKRTASLTATSATDSREVKLSGKAR